MRNKPDAAALLHVARETLLGELLASLPEERRAAARMVAEAMAIAAREAEAGEADLARELRLLTELYGEATVQSAGGTLKDRIHAMNRRFAKDIRAGIFDGACAPGVRALLLEQARARLRVSNPEHLRELGLE